MSMNSKTWWLHNDLIMTSLKIKCSEPMHFMFLINVFLFICIISKSFVILNAFLVNVEIGVGTLYQNMKLL